jgi:hypothetical protein
VDVESLDLIELIDFDLNELLGTRVEHLRANSLAIKVKNEELIAQEQLQEVITDIIRY